MSENLKETLIAAGMFLLLFLASGLGNRFIDGIH